MITDNLTKPAPQVHNNKTFFLKNLHCSKEKCALPHMLIDKITFIQHKKKNLVPKMLFKKILIQHSFVYLHFFSMLPGGCAEKSGQLFAADELLSVNGTDVTSMSRIEAWGLMKRLADGKVVLCVRHKTIN